MRVVREKEGEATTVVASELSEADAIAKRDELRAGKDGVTDGAHYSVEDDELVETDPSVKNHQSGGETQTA